MKEYSRIQKFIYIIIIFIASIILSGCYSTRVISNSDLFDSIYSSKYNYVVHSEKVKFLLEEPTISTNEILSGKIKQTYMDNYYDKENFIHLYFSADSVIKIDTTGEFLSVSINEITKAELREINQEPPYIIIVGCIVFGLSLVFLRIASYISIF